VVVNVHHLGEQLRAALGDGAAYGVRIRYSTEAALLDTGGGIRFAGPLLDELMPPGIDDPPTRRSSLLEQRRGERDPDPRRGPLPPRAPRARDLRAARRSGRGGLRPVRHRPGRARATLPRQGRAGGRAATS